jgi:hypothetical protein
MVRSFSKIIFISLILFAVPVYSQNAKENFSKGMDYYNQGEQKLAEHYFQLAIQADPTYKEAYLHLGLMNLNKKKFFESYKIFKTGLHYNHCDLDLRANLEKTVGFVIAILKEKMNKTTDKLGDTGKIINLPDTELTNYIENINRGLIDLHTCFVCNGTGIIFCSCINNDNKSSDPCPYCKNELIYPCPTCKGTGEWCPH